jgi:hypothetical protein
VTTNRRSKTLGIKYLACAALVTGSVLASCGIPAGSPSVEAHDPGSHRVFAGLKGVWHPSHARVYTIERNQDDGTQADGNWLEDGYASGHNYVGSNGEGRTFIAALRFTLSDLAAGERIAHARLRLAPGNLSPNQAISLRITGALASRGRSFSDAYLPSQLARTETVVTWSLMNWSAGSPTAPSYRTSPDISGIVNEITSRPGWHDGNRTLTLILEPSGSPPTRPGYIACFDRSSRHEVQHPACLEIFMTTEDAFVAPPMLGRPTDRSITVNVINLNEIDVYAEYGTTSGIYTDSTEPVIAQPAGRALELVIAGLDPDTIYFYRLRYRRPGESSYAYGNEHSFRTQRAKGSPFRFTIQADSHILPGVVAGDTRRMRLYDLTLLNAVAEQPDFHMTLGDFAHIEFYAGRSAASLLEAEERYLLQRQFLADISHSVPFYLVIGNHEGEQGWRRARENDSLEVWGTLARKEMIPNPYPDDFYEGNDEVTDCCGLREDYYAWEWGDALFVVLDPFWNTKRRPHRTGGGYGPSLDGWDWTLGKSQYEWLHSTLRRSTARWKFVFSHHMTGGCLGGKHGDSPYGRGGKDAAKFKVAGRPSFEWGGEDSLGNYVFDVMRPGWEYGPIHDMLVSEGVDIFLRGHDHAFVYEDLDGLAYQTCPQPADITYSSGEDRLKFFASGIPRNNSGHVRVSVFEDSVRVDYVRSVLPEDEPLSDDGIEVRNATVSYSYTLRK